MLFKALTALIICTVAVSSLHGQSSQSPALAADCQLRPQAPTCASGLGTASDSTAIAADPAAVEHAAGAGLHPVPVGTLTSSRLSVIDPVSLPDLMRGFVTSTYSLDAGPRNDLYRTVRIRGPVGFTTCPSCGPKILLDGVEVNPIALGSLNVQLIDRVEIVRGPHGALIYGSDAANGVILLFSRQGPVAEGFVGRARGTVGTSSSPYLTEASLERSVVASVGGRVAEEFAFSAGLSHSGGSGHVPEYRRDSSSGALTIDGAVGRLRVSGFGRFSQKDLTLPGWAAAYYDLYLDGILPSWGERIDEDDVAAYQNLTLGATFAYQVTPWWSTALVVGHDRVEYDIELIPTFAPSDSMVTAERDHFSRPSARLTSTFDFEARGQDRLMVHLGIDHRASDRLRYESFHYETGRPRITNWRGQILDEQFAAGGAFAEGMYLFDSGLRISAGVRGDHHSSFGDDIPRLVRSHRAGASYDTSLGGWTMRARAAWAEALSAPSYEMKVGTVRISPNGLLEPQTTSGWEMGLEVGRSGGALMGSATLFRQATSDAVGEATSYPGEEEVVFSNFIGTLLSSGAEFELWWLGRDLQVGGNLSLISNQTRDPLNVVDSSPVRFDPAPSTTALLEATHQLRHVLGRDLYWGGRITHLGERWGFDVRGIYTAVSEGREADSQLHGWFPAVTRTDLFTGADFGPVEARIEVRNITAELQPEIPEIVVAGRQLRVTLGTRF